MTPKILRKLRLGGSAILLVVATNPCLRGDASPSDDGWRRTAQGWEMLHTEPVPALVRTLPHSNYPHPLLLAALQVVFVAAAYWRFPVKR